MENTATAPADRVLSYFDVDTSGENADPAMRALHDPRLREIRKAQKGGGFVFPPHAFESMLVGCCGVLRSTYPLVRRLAPDVLVNAPIKFVHVLHAIVRTIEGSQRGIHPIDLAKLDISSLEQPNNRGCRRCVKRPLGIATTDVSPYVPHVQLFRWGTFSDFVEFDAIELIAWFLYQRLVTTLSVARRIPQHVLCPFTSIGLVTEGSIELARRLRNERP